jgi:hypothetical protein
MIAENATTARNRVGRDLPENELGKFVVYYIQKTPGRCDVSNGEKNFRLLMGSALLRSYKSNWLARIADIDSFVEELSRTVTGIDPEALTCAKEKSERYRQLSRDVKRMDKILADMTEDQMFIIGFYHWSGHSVEELAEIFSTTPRTMYRWIDAIDKKVYIGWSGSWEI